MLQLPRVEWRLLVREDGASPDCMKVVVVVVVVVVMRTVCSYDVSIHAT